jgi:hypothetical protein
MALSELKIKALIRLIEHEKITVEDIKDADYKAEVESRLSE